MKEQGVDLTIFGHNHYYERMWPVYSYTVNKDGCDENRYHNAKDPIQLITGSAVSFQRIA